jgi:ABC-type sugar transport system ATPase subunit
MAAIDIAGVVKAFGTAVVIHAVDLAVRDGEFVVLVGPSGCGKSTLLRMIAGLESVSGGTIRIGDRVVNDAPPRDRDIAMVFQDYALYPHKSVAENIGFGLKMRGVDAATIGRKVQEAAQILQIGHLLGRKPGQLSGGQRQRVAMGRAIVREPKVFLFDEPLSNLDAHLRAEMRAEIKKLHQRFGTTIIYVTHDQVEAMTLADRIAILRAGRLEQFDTPAACYARPNSTFVAGFIGSPAMNFLRAGVSAEGREITLAGDLRLPAPPALAQKIAARAGGDITLGLRPEHVGAAGSGGVAAPARVSLVEPLGSDTLALIRLGDSEITGRFPPETELRPGLEVTVALQLDKAHVFDRESGRALAG